MNKEDVLPLKGDFRNLIAYQKTECIYDITYYFAHTFLDNGDRTRDQMIQAARSGKQNIVEGCSASTTSAETEIKLLNVAKASLQELLEDPDVESDEIKAAMDDLNVEIEKKADGYAKVIRNLEGNLAAVKAEQEKLTAKKNVLESGIKRLKEDLQEVMTATGKRKFKTDLFSFNIQKNGGADPVIVDVPTEELPDDLVIVTEKPDLKAIAAYIKETGDITFAHFGERGESLRIK